MAGAFIGILAGITAIAGGMLGRLAARPGKANLEVGAAVVSICGGLFSLILCPWGIWELVSCFTGTALVSTFPTYWIFWLATGASDLALGVAMAAMAILSFQTLSLSSKVVAIRRRARLGSVVIALGVAGIVLALLFGAMAIGLISPA